MNEWPSIIVALWLFVVLLTMTPFGMSLMGIFFAAVLSGMLGIFFYVGDGGELQ